MTAQKDPYAGDLAGQRVRDRPVGRAVAETAHQSRRTGLQERSKSTRSPAHTPPPRSGGGRALRCDRKLCMDGHTARQPARRSPRIAGRLRDGCTYLAARLRRRTWCNCTRVVGERMSVSQGMWHPVSVSSERLVSKKRQGVRSLHACCMGTGHEACAQARGWCAWARTR